MTANHFAKRTSRLWRTQQEIADALGVTRGCIGHWINGRRRVPGTVVKLLKCIEAASRDQVAQKPT